MSDLGDEVRELQTKVELAQRALHRAEAEYDAATAQAERAAAKLNQEYGVSTVEAAKELLAAMEAELAAELVRLRSALSEISA